MSDTQSAPGLRQNACPFRWDAADAYLFDIDGTLLNSRDGVHYNAFHNALLEFFRVSSSIDGVPLHGNTDRAIIRAVLRREGVPEPELPGNADWVPRRDDACRGRARRPFPVRAARLLLRGPRIGRGQVGLQPHRHAARHLGEDREKAAVTPLGGRRPA